MATRLWPRVAKSHPIELLQLIHSNPMNKTGTQSDYLSRHGRFYDPPQDVDGLMNAYISKHGSLRRSGIAFIPHFDQKTGLNILLVKKASKNTSISNHFPHANQYAFPGGMLPKDIDFEGLTEEEQEGVLLDSVVRELTEEVGGIVEEGIFPLYQLPPTQTNTSFVHVHPFVIYLGRTDMNALHIKDTNELTELHHVNIYDLARSYNPEGVVHYDASSVMYRGPSFHPPQLESPIWGLTARLLAYVFTEMELVLKNQEQASSTAPDPTAYLKSIHGQDQL